MVVKNHPLNYFACWLVAGLSVLLSSVFIYWIIFQQPPVRNVELSAVDAFTWQGGQFRLKYAYEGEISCPHYTIYTITDEQNKVYRSTSNLKRQGGIYLVSIPRDVAIGDLTYNEIVYFKCNPFKEHAVTSPEVKVTVLK